MQEQEKGLETDEKRRREGRRGKEGKTPLQLEGWNTGNGREAKRGNTRDKKNRKESR